MYKFNLFYLDMQEGRINKDRRGEKNSFEKCPFQIFRSWMIKLIQLKVIIE
jgi:hypothetical protein